MPSRIEVAIVSAIATGVLVWMLVANPFERDTEPYEQPTYTRCWERTAEPFCLELAE